MSLYDLDLSILKFINQPFITSLNLIFIVVIYSAYAYLVFLLFYYYKTKQKDKFIHLLLVSAIGIIFVNLLKYTIKRPRPYDAHPEIKSILTKADPSFPSAHTAISFICFKFIPQNISNLFKYLSWIYLLILIPFGSMYVGVHYPSDVLGGAIIGLLMPRIITEKMAKKLTKRFFK